MGKNDEPRSGPVGNQDPSKRGLGRAQEEYRKDAERDQKQQGKPDKR